MAHQYNLTVEELKTLNQKRNFARAFEQLSAGDQIDVPSTYIANTTDKTTKKGVQVNDSDSEIENWLAQTAPNFFQAMNTQSAEEYLTK
ncbi:MULTISPECIES: hypothetical protein [unclassified Providencia]|nr:MULTISPECIES: hypothetical protein [unclassified Providencia]ELR5297739.1 hypothetical protein [Providencia rettgeri]MCL0016465.1 hypothetical protein [Providencia rettgeri]